MSNDKKEYEEIENEINSEIMDNFQDKIGFAISMVMHEHEGEDCNLELLSTLLMLAAHVGAEIGIETESYLELAGDFLNNHQVSDENETEFDKTKAN